MVARDGIVRFDGQRIDGRASEDIARLGIAHTCLRAGTFVGFTVEGEPAARRLRAPRPGRRRAGPRTRLHALPVLGTRRRRPPGRCPAASSRCSRWRGPLILRPRLLLLDEDRPSGPARGAGDLPHHVRTINQRDGVSVLVEQNAALALGLADHAYLLETRTRRPRGASRQIRRNDGPPEHTLGIDTFLNRSSRGSPPAVSTRASPWRW
jgi:branched-chain amino acid transport system ATP-binding protein